MNFENEHWDDDEVQMAKADLFKLAKYSMKLFKMMHEGQELEAWVQAKITKASDYIASVYHFMEYDMRISEYGERLEDSDIYSESVKAAYSQKLMEAKDNLKQYIMKETAYDTQNHPKFGKIKWINYGGAHLIAKEEPGKPMIVYAIGSHNEIAQKWKALKAKSAAKFESIEMCLEAAKPSAGLTKKEKSTIVKKAKKGEDLGKPGKGFEKVEKAAKKSGAKDPEAVAGAAFWKGQAKAKKGK
jgi:hypothetical protein